MYRTSTKLVAILAAAALSACAAPEAELDAVQDDMAAAIQAGDIDLAYQLGEDFLGTPFNTAPDLTMAAGMVVGQYHPHPVDPSVTRVLGRALATDDTTTHMLRGVRVAPTDKRVRGEIATQSREVTEGQMGEMTLDYGVSTAGYDGQIRGMWHATDLMQDVYITGRWVETDVDSGRIFGVYKYVPQPTWDKGVRIRTEISGRTLVIIGMEGLHFHHMEGPAPGLDTMGGTDTTERATIVNGKVWAPTWPSEGENADCNCDSDVFQAPSGAVLPLDGGNMTLEVLQARGGITLLAQASAENDYHAVFEIDDTAYDGPAWYEFTLRENAF